MATLYVVEQGATLSCEGERLAIIQGTESRGSVPLVKIEDVVIFGNVAISTPALKRLLDQQVDVTFLTVHGRYHGRLVGRSTAHVMLRRQQYRRADDPEWSLQTAQCCVEGKLRNCRAVLQRFARQRAHPPAELSEIIADGAEALARVRRTTRLQSLLGVEGSATARYFGGLRLLFEPEWHFQTRNRRPPADPVNVLLSLGYTLLTHKALGMVQTVGFDPFQGFLHQLDYNRPALALDLIEEFRPFLVDALVVRCCGDGRITPADFSPSDDPTRPIVLSDEAKRRFITAFEERMRMEVTHPEGAGNQPGKVTYLRCVELQARRLARAIQSGGCYEPWSVR